MLKLCYCIFNSLRSDKGNLSVASLYILCYCWHATNTIHVVNHRAMFQYKDCLFRYGHFHCKDKMVHDCHLFRMGIPRLARHHIYTETAPRSSLWYLDTLRLRQDGRPFPDDIFKSIFFNENIHILIKISLTFVPKAPINNIPALVQIMAWHRPGDKPSSEPMMVSLLTHICVTRPQWINCHWKCWKV